MKEGLKKFGWQGGVFVILFASIISTSIAVDGDADALDPYIEGDLSVAQCAAKGKIDFLAFLEASIFADGFDQGVVEQFADILTRNQCQSADVLSLINRRDKIRSQLRDAFLKCETQKIDSLKMAYNKANVEIYYVRHVVDASATGDLPFATLTEGEDTEKPELSEEALEKFYYPRAKLKAEMKERYADTGAIEPAEFDIYFDQLESKYNDRKRSYLLCESSNWKEVSIKWQEFIDSAAGTTEAWKDMKKSVSGGAEKIVESVTETTFKNYLSGIASVSLNNQSPQAGFEEILAGAGNYIPIGGVVTQESAFSAVLSANKAFDIEKIETELRANVDTLYKETGDSAVEVFITGLNDLNQAIIDSYTPQAKILSCTQTINSRQCAEKE